MLDSKTRLRLCASRARLRGGDPSPISVIAREAGFSLYHYTRLFKAVFGSSPHRCRIAGRLERAKLLLATTERPVTEICFGLGFSSLGTFSRVFAAKTGFSPRSFRKSFAGSLKPESELRPACMELMQRAYSRKSTGSPSS